MGLFARLRGFRHTSRDDSRGRRESIGLTMPERAGIAAAGPQKSSQHYHGTTRQRLMRAASKNMLRCTTSYSLTASAERPRGRDGPVFSARRLKPLELNSPCTLVDVPVAAQRRYGVRQALLFQLQRRLTSRCDRLLGLTARGPHSGRRGSHCPADTDQKLKRPPIVGAMLSSWK